MIAHDVLVLFAELVIDIIADQHIQRLSNVLPKGLQHLRVRLRVHPVVAVHHFKIKPRCIAKPRHDRPAVPRVFLMNGADDGRIALRIGIGDFRGLVP